MYLIDVVLDDSSLSVKLSLDIVLNCQGLLCNFGGVIELIILSEESSVEFGQLSD